MRTRSAALAIIASAGLAASALGASASFPLGNLNVGEIPGSVVNTPLGALGFTPNRAVVTTNWVAGAGNPWSNEAIWAVADGPLVSAVNFYFDPGAAPNSAGNGNPVSLSWDVISLQSGYDPLPPAPDISAVPLTFIAGQTFGGSNAFWNNTVVTLSDDGVANLPSNIIDLGIVANQNTPFSLSTDGSDFDTELGFFNSQGGLAESHDDVNYPSIVTSLLNVPGLPAGSYIINAGGYNTIYGNGGYEAVVDSFGSDGGNLVLKVDGSPIYAGALAADTNQFFRIHVAVPTPGTITLAGLAGLATLRRRRR